MTVDAVGLLRRQLPTERFAVLTDPLSWRCLGCDATVVAAGIGPGSEAGVEALEGEVKHLAEIAADHALFCGRCDD